MRHVLLSLVAALAATLTFTSTFYAQPSLQFQLGFRLLADQIPSIVGGPLEDEHHNPANGDALQQTTRGLMVWRKADNWTAFTDGSRTWVNGPAGVQERGNDERFDWEAPAQRPALMQAQPLGAGFDVAAEQAALDMVNQSRQQNGVPPVTMDEALRQVARAHARDMSVRNYFSHSSPEGMSPFDRMRAAGISFGAAAENMGYSVGHGSPTDAVRSDHNAMMAEAPPNDGHRKNILNGSLHRAGIGVYTGQDGKTYYVCDFID